MEQKNMNEEILKEGEIVDKNELAPTKATELEFGLFNSEESSVRKKTSLDLNDSKDVDLLLNSMNDVDYKLNDCIGKEIVCTNFLVTERKYEEFDDGLEEIAIRKKHTLILFDNENKSYVTGSNACYRSFEAIVSLKGIPTRHNPLVLIPIKVEGKEKGHEYLKLKIKIEN